MHTALNLFIGYILLLIGYVRGCNISKKSTLAFSTMRSQNELTMMRTGRASHSMTKLARTKQNEQTFAVWQFSNLLISCLQETRVSTESNHSCMRKR